RGVGAGQRARRGFRTQLTGGPGDTGAARDRLDAAAIAAGAEGPVPLNHDVANLAGTPLRSCIELAANHAPGPDARGYGHVDQLAGAAAGPAPVLGEGRQVRVVMQVAANAGRRRQDPVQRDVAAPWQIGG